MSNPDLPPVEQIEGIWSVIDPCAFLCYAVQTGALPYDEAIYDTLCAFGWITSEELPDFAHMQQEFQKHANRPVDNNASQ